MKSRLAITGFVISLIGIFIFLFIYQSYFPIFLYEKIGLDHLRLIPPKVILATPPVISISLLVCFPLLALTGLILSIASWIKIKKSNGETAGLFFAIFGIIVNIILLLISLSTLIISQMSM